MCWFFALEEDGLTHWCGYDCDEKGWFVVCSQARTTHGVLVDVPTLPLCGVCLAASDVEVEA